MTIKFFSKDIKITPDIEESANKKISQRLNKYSQRQDGDKTVTVKVFEKKPFTRVDVDMPYFNYRIHAEAETADGILGGIDKCMDILERQISKFKTRMHKSRVKSSSLKKDILDIVNDDELIASSSDTDDVPNYKIIKVDAKPNPMSVEEAVLQMEVLEYKFLFFLNTETETASVVYKRDDGNVGLMEM